MRNSMFEPIVEVSAEPLIIENTDVDTDQIIPARFLTVTTRDGLGANAFYDWRHDKAGAVIEDHYLNATPPAGRKILVAGKNFGCGSSREHAPWALHDYGVRIILADSIADIFRNNCSKNGIAAINIESSLYEQIVADREKPVSVDLEARTITLANGTVASFELDEMARQCLMSGEDQMGLLLSAQDEISAYEPTISMAR